MIAHLLRASGPDRDDLLLQDHLWQYSNVWDHGLALGELDHDFKMSMEDLRAPSSEFLAVLRDAGLQDWLMPDSDFGDLPPQETPAGKFLGRELGYRWYEAGPHAPFGPFTPADILRSLAHHVDMSALHSQTHQDTPSISEARATASPAVPTQRALVAEGSTILPSKTRRAAQSVYSDTTDTYHGRGSFDLAQVVVDSARDVPYLKPVDRGTAAGTDAVLNSIDDAKGQSTAGANPRSDIEVVHEDSGQKQDSAPGEPQEECAEKDDTLSDLEGLETRARQQESEGTLNEREREPEEVRTSTEDKREQWMNCRSERY
ncbi:hypothetical protein PENSPDRAFT_655966 [Peniophora sp. CONT]|nr:hypothetical protein PENSPDRAFT_655966 [Peniophora sp. CONT]